MAMRLAKSWPHACLDLTYIGTLPTAALKGWCDFRESCIEELKRITEHSAERHRILTLCSSAANQRRIYDKSLIKNLKSCTAWINQHKDDVIEAYVMATRNTQLGSVTNAHVRCYFLFMALRPVDKSSEPRPGSSL